MIEVRELVKKYGNKTVLDHVSFDVKDGEILGLLGPIGAGKSTTMNIITGNLAATDGTAAIDGHEILEEPLRAKKELGYLPEIPPLYVDMTVKAYLSFIYRLKKCKLPKKEHLEEVCRAVQIIDVYDRVIKNLSKGYRQRIGIAQAMIGNPKVLILDEPTVGLDPKQMIEIRNLIRSFGKTHTVILSSHILSEVQAVCDRVVVINKGKVIADDTAENLSGHLNGRRLRVKVEGPQKMVEEGLKTILGVKAVYPIVCTEPGCCAFELQSDEHTDIRRQTSAYFKASPWLLLEFTEAEISLENIFLKLTDSKGGKK